MPLVMAGLGEPVRVTGIRAGRRAETRLRELGLVVGAEVSLVQRQPGEPVVLAIAGSRVGVGFGLAQHVMVAPLGAGGEAVPLDTTVPDLRSPEYKQGTCRGEGTQSEQGAAGKARGWKRWLRS